ncbi:MAG: hypothetical protein QNL91_11710 [Candidatus Krumholzibacteria bacterium]|nr:hypothetical protein [Candidatus Krumholzibacteria bacterium]
MSEHCYQPDDFERLLELAENHEDRRHLEECAACRAEFDLYRSFMARHDVPEGADLSDAHARLGDFLAKEIVAGAATVGLDGLGQDNVIDAKRHWNLRRWSPVLAAACIACVAILINLGDDQQIVSPSGVVRDMPGNHPTLASSVTTTADGFLLSWQGPATADDYEVVVLDTAMAEVARFGADLSGQFPLATRDHQWLQSAGPLLWYVVALQNGDEIARSTVRTLERDP